MKKIISAVLVLMILLTTAASLSVSAALVTDTARECSDGSSYRLADIASSAVAQETISDEDSGIANQDGINTNAATTWIIIVSAAASVAIFTMVIILSKRNKK